MTDRPPRRPRRVQLSTPGSSEKMIQKASESKADHVFLDLEDAVAPSQKRDARKKIIEGLKTLNWKGKTRCVRINDLTTEYAYEDIIEVVEGAGEHLDTIMMTKVMTPADVLFADKLLFQMEKKLKLKRRIGLEALIEEVEGMQNDDAIAKSTPRLECLVFGMGDFSASMGVTNKNVGENDGYPGDIWHYARFRLIMACRAAGIDPVDARIPVELDTPIAQHRLEGIAYRAVVRRQDGATRIQQVEVQVVRIPPCGAQFVAQPVLHGQRQFNAPGPGANDSNTHRTRMPDNPLK